MTTEALKADRLQQVARHVECENRHDLDAVMGTFGLDATYDDEPWNDHRRGRDAVRDYYAELLGAVPDLHIEVRRRHVADDAVVLETTITGTHQDAWHGLPPTGRGIVVPLCGVFTFDDAANIAGERIYYDRADVLQQLGVLHDPESQLGRITTALVHPVTMARIAARSLQRDRA
ncbi:MAG TPA: ester cyclase [Acidimicrobiia bacterium]|jgi:steroid delta-isomerase-like uncharacterized protein